MDVGKKVRLVAGTAGMAPVLGLAVAAPAAAAPAVHASGKQVSLHAGQAAACHGTFSKVATAASSNLSISVSHKGDCVLGVTGLLRINESPGSLSGDIMRTRVFNHGTQVFSNRLPMFDNSGGVSRFQPVGMVGHQVCVTAFSQSHPTKKIAGPVCVKF